MDALQQFQFTPLREGRLEFDYTLGGENIFQFTPLREGRPSISAHQYCQMSISIHAPA